MERGLQDEPVEHGVSMFPSHSCYHKTTTSELLPIIRVPLNVKTIKNGIKITMQARLKSKLSKEPINNYY